MATLVVSNTNDTVNGDVSSISALNASSGGDGISLREAITAVNATPGVHIISFAPALTGQTIEIESTLPEITRSGLTVQGAVTDGAPAVTLDFSTMAPSVVNEILVVQASDVTISGLRFEDMPARHVAIFVRADDGVGVPLVERVTIRNCEFESTGGVESYAIRIGTDARLDPAGSTVKDVRVEDSVFLHVQGDVDAIHVQAAGNNSLVEGTVIRGNTFVDTTLPVELVTFDGAGNRIAGTLIIGNMFTDSSQAITLLGGGGSNGGTIDGTLISHNVISGVTNPAIGFTAGLGNDSIGNVISNTTMESNLIVNNTPPGGGGGIAIVGGQDGASGNAVNGVLIVNNTLIRGNGSAGIGVISGELPDGNAVTGVVVRNTIFFGQEGGNDFEFDMRPEDIYNSILTDDPLNFAGDAAAALNGNIKATPMFVDAANGDYRLQAGSPAIDAGLGTGAPIVDFDYLGRFDAPEVTNTGAGTPAFVDIGAYEFMGGTGNDVLSGTDAADTLRGGAGIDRLTGVSGDDDLGGGPGRDTLNGNEGNDVLRGDAASDVLNGGSGNDTLDGGGGADEMKGGPGDDTYFVDADGDAVTELASAGTDTVNASITYALPDNVENLTLTGAGNINGTGNGQDNILTGNKGKNVLDGDTGADTLKGMGGNDTLIWHAADKSVDGGAGTDALKVASGNLNLLNVLNTTIVDVETIDLRGGGNNRLTLEKADVLDMSSTTDTLKVLGDVGDTLHISGGHFHQATDNLEGFHRYTFGPGVVLQIDDHIALV